MLRSIVLSKHALHGARAFATASGRTFLVAVDGSEPSKAAFKQTCELAGKQDNVLTVTVPPMLGLDVAKVGPELVETFKKQAEKTVMGLQKEFEQMAQQQCKVRSRALSHSPALPHVRLQGKFEWKVGDAAAGARSELVRVAQERGVHMVVLGSKGHGPLHRHARAGEACAAVPSHALRARQDHGGLGGGSLRAPCTLLRVGCQDEGVRLDRAARCRRGAQDCNHSMHCLPTPCRPRPHTRPASHKGARGCA